ncbi:MAG: type II toxin-antitoxin system VapC family toxin [Acidobacteriaceae bacterium]|nr:type II toxin-antitoxin system VapC family toxin [Acidobacteriaceae bacterium]
MRLLLDTHALIWWFNDPSQLSETAYSLLQGSANGIFISAAVAWELAIKVNLGKLDALPLVSDLPNHITEEGFTELPISMAQAIRAGLLPKHHRDPFDRVLVAQAQELNIPVLSADRFLDRYDVKRIW